MVALRTHMNQPVSEPLDPSFLGAGGLHLAPPVGNSVSPTEGAALIRAFMRVEEREVRDAITEFVTRLSDALARTR